MDFVGRYLHAVGFWLPRSQRQDIVAELSEDIRSEVEEQERQLERPLKEDEVAALLKQRGHPFLVASRYLPQEHLIGPVLFPLYRFVLKLVAGCYLVPWVLVWIGFLIFDPAFRSAHGGSSVVSTLGAFWADFWIAALVALAIVTLVFAVIEKSQAKAGWLTKWDPRTLAPVRDPNRIPRASSIFELAAGLAFTAWWIAGMAGPVVLDRSGVRITMAPVWTWFYWGYIAIAMASLAMSGTNLLYPRWTKRRAVARAAWDAVGAVVFCSLCVSRVLGEIAVNGVPAAQMEAVTRAINAWAARAVPIVAAIGLLTVAVDFYRFVRVDRAERQPIL